jgi:hypothetical protein
MVPGVFYLNFLGEEY